MKTARALLVLVCVVIAAMSSWRRPVVTQSTALDALDALEQRARDLDRIDNVQQRAGVGDYYRLADAYLAAGRSHDARLVLVRALSLDPGNARRQVQAAQLEIDGGLRDAAHARLTGVLARQADDAARARARELVERMRASGYQPPAAKRPAMSAHVLVLVAFEGVDGALVQELAGRIGHAFGLTTRVLPGSVAATRRGSREAACSPTKVQLDADAVLPQLATMTASTRAEPGCVGAVGVVAEDLFADNLNFLFGTAGDGAGVLSLARFGEAGLPREALLARATKQAFSTTGFVLGVPRCSSASCARAYPH